MDIDRMIESSVREVEQLFDTEPVPERHRTDGRRLRTGVVIAAIALVAISVPVLLTRDLTPPIEGVPTVPTTTAVPGLSVDPIPLDGEVSIVPVRMRDGSLFSILLPTALLPAQISLDLDVESATLTGDGLEARLTFTHCAGTTQDQGSLNSRGAVVVPGQPGVVCRPDQLLVLEIPTGVPNELTEHFDIVPIKIEDDYLGVIEALGMDDICCDSFGPLQHDQLVITASRWTGGTVIAWDANTLLPVWSTEVGEASILLGLSDDIVLVTPGRGSLLGLRATDGAVIWEVGLEPEESTAGASRGDGDTWFISVHSPIQGDMTAPRLFAIDTRSGNVLWAASARPGTVLQGLEPVVFPDAVVLMDAPKLVGPDEATETAHLTAFDPTTGAERWHLDLGDPTEAFSSRLLAGDPSRGILIAITPSGIAYSISPQTGEVNWRTPTGPARIASIDEDTVTLEGSRSARFSLSLDTGELVD